jgi:hypothetical protein
MDGLCVRRKLQVKYHDLICMRGGEVINLTGLVVRTCCSSMKVSLVEVMSGMDPLRGTSHPPGEVATKRFKACSRILLKVRGKPKLVSLI